MRISKATLRLRVVLCLLVLAVPVQESQRTNAASALLPIENSPLAAAADALYAIADDKKRLLTRPADLSKGWRLLEGVGEFERLAGLTISGSDLYITDAADESILKLDLKTRKLTTLYKNGPLGNPSSIAVVRDVFVADDSRRKLFRLNGAEMYEVPLSTEITGSGILALAGSGDDLLISSSNGSISELLGIGRSDPRAPLTIRQNSDPFASTSSSLVFSVARPTARGIKQPVQLSIWKGIVYVVDAEHEGIFAFSRYDRRPVRVTRRIGIGAAPTSIAVNENFLYIMSGRVVQHRPRVVPAQVSLRLVSVSEAMTEIFEYLQRNNITPLQQVLLDKDVVTTLKKNSILPAGYVEALEPTLCKWNPEICAGNPLRIRTDLQQGRPFWVPELYSESFVDTAPVVLDGTKTLGEVADQRIRSPELKEWTSEARLRDLNERELVKSSAVVARAVNSGELLAPVEYLRYLIPVRPADVRLNGELRKLEQKYSGLRIISLEEREQQSQAESAELVDLAAFNALKTEFERMTKTVGYVPASSPLVAKIGIAEKGVIDRSHPDLRGAFIDADAAIPSSSRAVRYVIRSREDRDHGTMVAGLVGARASAFKQSGLAPQSLLLLLQGNDPQIGSDITNAHNRGVKLFNISAHYGKGIFPSALSEAIVQYDDSLFIVAAGNDQQSICGAFTVFPACWAEHKNVLVVTATDPDGGVLLTNANWSDRKVHLAAPGRGYHAPGADGSYVPVDGTSFATPLVTAASAILYADKFLNPWSIKQRLIATADPLPESREKIVGGRLNIKAALKDMSWGVLSRDVLINNENRIEEQKITLTNETSITIRKRNGESQSISLKRLLRFHRNPDGRLRIIYINEEDTDILVLDGVTFPNDRPKAAQFVATADTQETKSFDLEEWNDYVAPVNP